jgi:3-hydroxyacyl-[acyl-carrier-protein] dehydratase
MRFLFYDKVLALEPSKRILTAKSISMGDEFLPEHYPRKPVMPAALILECVAQAGGWLYIVTENFAITTVLGLVQGVQINGLVFAGDTLEMEVWMQFGHRGGTTMRAEARNGNQPVMSVDRLVFASQPLRDAEAIQSSRQLFRYLSGDFPLDGARRS